MGSAKYEDAAYPWFRPCVERYPVPLTDKTRDELRFHPSALLKKYERLTATIRTTGYECPYCGRKWETCQPPQGQQGVAAGNTGRAPSAKGERR